MSVGQVSAGALRLRDTAPATECAGWSCDLVSAATDPVVLAAVGLVGVAAFVALAYVRDAKAACRSERRRVLDEREAFEEFAVAVARLDTAPVPATVSSLDGPAATVRTGAPFGGEHATGGDVRLRRVLASYRDTVMSVPHYREEYDESVAESLAAELGPDTTAALASNGTLSPGAQSALVRRSRRAADARSSLADAIAAEEDALARYETDLERVDRRRRRLVEHLDGVRSDRTGAAIDVWERLGDLEPECDAIAEERQRSLGDPPMRPAGAGPGSGNDDGRSFYEYLYGPVDGPGHPVLAQVVAITERVRRDRDRVASRIAGGN